MDILVGLFLITFGLVIAFLGLQFFFVMLPLVGLVSGFYLGAAFVNAGFGDGFLSTVAGWIIGIALGLLFAVIAWLWWYAGVLVAAASTGALLGSLLAEGFGMSSHAVIFLFAAVGAALFFVGALALDLPIYLVIVNTAIGGASIVVSGLLLVFNQMDRTDLTDGFAVANAEVSWWWVLVWAVIAAIGIGRQLQLKDRIQLPGNRWTQAGTARA